jgi:hypothetical protein
MEDAPVTTLRSALLPLLLFTLGLAVPAQMSAQAQSVPINPDAGCRYCHRVALPLGLYVTEILEDGRYVMLEDGSVWEVRLSQRPIASSWRPGDFVRLKTIWAPVGEFETLLSHGDNDKAEVRLAGRGQAPKSELPD